MVMKLQLATLEYINAAVMSIVLVVWGWSQDNLKKPQFYHIFLLSAHVTQGCYYCGFCFEIWSDLNNKVCAA